MRTYEYRHIVSFEETNVVGNVYYANHILWQGRCREMFLREFVPEILEEFNRGLSLVTTHVSCNYYNEVFAFDEILIRLTIKSVSTNQVTMLFKYYCLNRPEVGEIAEGKQQVVSMKMCETELTRIPLPIELLKALEQFTS